MFTILVVGMTGQGKSQWVKNYLKGVKSFVFDINNEYGGLASERYLIDAKGKDETGFINECFNKTGTVCVFEEATGFFEGKTGKELRRLLINKRHTKNNYIFIFHSLSSVPPRIMQMANFLVLFKTGDEAYQVESKFPSLVKDHENVMKMKQYSFITKKLIEQ